MEIDYTVKVNTINEILSNMETLLSDKVMTTYTQVESIHIPSDDILKMYSNYNTYTDIVLGNGCKESFSISDMIHELGIGRDKQMLYRMINPEILSIVILEAINKAGINSNDITFSIDAENKLNIQYNPSVLLSTLHKYDTNNEVEDVLHITINKIDK